MRRSTDCITLSIAILFFSTLTTYGQEIPEAVQNLSVVPTIQDVETQYWGGGEFGEVTWRAILTWSGGREGCYRLYAQWLDIDEMTAIKSIPIEEVICGETYVHGMEFVDMREGSRTIPVLQLYDNGRPLMKVVLSQAGKYRIIRD